MSVEASGGRAAEFAQGWNKVLTAFVGVGLGITSIFFYTQGLFIKPLQAEFGWSRAEASIMPTIFGLTLAVASPLCGRLVDRFGVRPVVVVSILCFAGGFWALSLMGGALAQFALIVLFMGVFASGTSATPYVRLVGGWFDKARGLAIGITMMGTGVAALIVPPLAGRYLQANGWRATYVVLAVAALAALPLVLIWAKERRKMAAAAAAPAVTGLSFGQAARTPRFWILGLTFTLAGAAVAGLVPHFIPMMQDAGMTPAQAAATFSIVGFAIVAGRLITGFLCDYFFAPLVATAVLALSAIGCLGLAFIGVPFAVVAALLIGLAMGAEIDLAGYMSARYFGLKSYGTIFGFQYGLFSVGAGLGPLLNGELFDRFGDYTVALVVSAAILLVSIPCVLSLGRYPDLEAD